MIIDDALALELRSQLGRAIYRICPAWLSAHRDDIVQAAIVRLLQLPERDEDLGPYPSSYVWKVAYSTMIDEIRRLRRLQTETLDVAVHDPESKDLASDPERWRVGSEIGNGIQCCLSTLNRDRRRAVTLHLIGHATPEIARLLGWKIKRVENALYRGLADLRACLSARGLRP